MAVLLLDQNIPYPVLSWLRSRMKDCEVHHCSDLGLGTADDMIVFDRAQELGATIITYDEDFADQRFHPVGTHHGVIRLRVEPTTDEVTVDALERLFARHHVDEIAGKLVIVEETRIRVIAKQRSS